MNSETTMRRDCAAALSGQVVTEAGFGVLC